MLEQNPDLFDPASPGPTVDLNMLEDPNTLDLVAEVAQDPSADPNEYVQSRMESSGGVTADAGGVTAGTSLTEPGVLEQGATDHQDLDDTVNL